MVVTEYAARFAFMNSNPSTGSSRSPARTKPRLDIDPEEISTAQMILRVRDRLSECKGGLALREELGEVLGLVLRGHEDADIDGAGLGGEAHTRFRILAERIPS